MLVVMVFLLRLVFFNSLKLIYFFNLKKKSIPIIKLDADEGN